jgi:hypothetical protein
MRLSAEAWRLREGARAAFAEGDFARGAALAAQAQQRQNTPAGVALLRIAPWLGAAER